jgi:hypothetical protein
MKAWFYLHAVCVIGDAPQWIEKLHFPTVKPPFFVGIDDRVLTFKGQWPAIDNLINFKAWNKKDAYAKSFGFDKEDA